METKESSETRAAPDENSTEKLWDAIGFHKPLAGFWYNLIFSLISMILGLFISGVIDNIFYPYPESNGYRGLAGGIFGLLFTIFDLGTHMTMDRFIAEARIKNPGRMLNYIQYFIWYQCWTGLIQTTLISIYALYIVPTTSLSYGIWIMLIVCTYQYPGYLGVFGGVLGSLQMYNKTAVLGFITGEGFQKLTELSFVFMGRMWGMANPAVGEIMGIAFGACIGVYIDDFFAMWLSAWFFSKAMKKDGIRARDCFRIGFGWDLIKECIVFGVKTGAWSLIGVFTGQVLLWINIIFIPQYATFSALCGLASGISGFVNWGGVSAPTPLIAEAFLNGKKKLTQYYFTQSLRYIVIFQMLFLPSIITVYFVLGKFFVAFSMENYLLALPFFFSTLIRNFQQPYTSFADSIQLGTNHPTFLMWLRGSEELLKIFFQMLWIVWLELPAKYGLPALVWIIPCGEYPAILYKTILSYLFTHKKVVKIKIASWQTLVAPIASGAIMFGLLSLVLNFVFNPVEKVAGFYVSIGITLVILLLLLLFGYLPITAFLGAWDTNSLRDFKHAALMSGPSKWFVWPMYKATEKACMKSKMFNKFPLDAEEAVIEARELLALKEANIAKTLPKRSWEKHE
ncbi:MAG: hypothetical protein GYA24_02515 [Candidatus Lokiarchaeota archaeon]|nr:hypothetical protein [Candidatus Lokiarchaeota archaeon]